MRKSADRRRRLVRRLRKRPLGRYRYVRLRWRVLFAAIDSIGYAVCRVVGRIRRLLGGTVETGAARPTSCEPQVILLAQLDHLGDAIITTAILPALRAKYPEASLEVLCGPWNREVFEAMPQVDRLHVSRFNRFARGRLRRFAWMAAALWWGLRLRRRKIGLGIDVRGEFSIAVILWLCGARRRLGFASGGGGFLLSDVAEFVPDRPEVESRWALLAPLGIEPPAQQDARRPRFHVEGSGFRVQGSGFGDRSLCHSRGATPRGCGRSDDAPLPKGAPGVVLHVGAGSSAKSWPAAHWQELLGRIIVAHAAEVALVGSGADRAIAREILGGRPWPGVTDCTGRLSIVELAEVLRQADVVVGADSAVAHLAAAVDTPVVVLFSGTNNPQQWRPCGSEVTVVRHEVECSPCHRERCPRPGHPCMSGLLPERVAAEVARALDRLAAATTQRDLPVEAVREGVWP